MKYAWKLTCQWMKIACIIGHKEITYSLIWKSQGAVYYSRWNKWLKFADCRHVFLYSQKKWYITRKQRLAQIVILQPSLYINKCTLYTYTGLQVYSTLVDLDSFSSSGVRPTPGLTSITPRAVCVYECVHTCTHTHTHALQPTVKKLSRRRQRP